MKKINKYLAVILFIIIISLPFTIGAQTKLKDLNGHTNEYSNELLINLLCNSNWTLGYGRIDFHKNYIYETGVMDTWEGKWKMTDEGIILVLPVFEGNDIEELYFMNTYTLTDQFNNIKYYSDEYYKAFSSTEESKKAISKNLSEITKNDIIGIWVTEEQGPMGEWLGFKFFEHKVYFGNPGLELPFGCWDDVEYKYYGTWKYLEKYKTIMIKHTKEDDVDYIKIKLNKFYNEAFEGSISPGFYFDEVGDSERTFWKSESKKK